MLLLALIIVSASTAVLGDSITLKKRVSVLSNTTYVQADLEVLAAVAEVDRITLPRKLGHVVEPTGHLILFSRQKIIVRDLATGQEKAFAIEPLCRPVVLDGISGAKHILLVCVNNLAYYLDFDNNQQFYGPYRLVEGDVVGVKRVGEYIVVVHANGLIAVYKGSLIDPYKTMKLPIQENIDEAYITQAEGNYTMLVAVLCKLQNGWFVAVVDLNTSSIVYSYKSSTPLVAAYIVDAYSPCKFKLLTVKHCNDLAILELAAIENSKPVLRVQERVRLPSKPQAYLYIIGEPYTLLIVGGGVGHLVDIYPDKMLVKSRFAWRYTPAIKEYIPIVVYEGRKYIVAVDYEGLKLLDSSGTPVWYVAAPCRNPLLVYGLGNMVVVGYGDRLVIVKPKQEFFKSLALLTVHAPKLHIDIAKKMFIPTIVVLGADGSVNVSVRGEKLSLLLPITSYYIKVVYEGLGITHTIHVVLEPPETRIEIPTRITSYTICVRGLTDPLHLLQVGKPLANALVQIYAVEGIRLGEIETDDSGCVRVNLPYASYRVRISAPGYIGGIFNISEPNTIVFLEPKLVPLEVKVVDAVTGYKIPNARVELVGFGRKIVISANSRLMVPPGTYTLLVSAEGYKSEKVEVTVNGLKRVKVSLEPSATKIVVVDGFTGQPIDKFYVNIVGSTIYGANYSISREANQTVLLKLPPGYYIVTISAKDYNVEEFVLKAPASKTIKLEPKPTTIVKRAAKVVFEQATSNPLLTTAIVAFTVVGIAIVKFRRRIRRAFEKVRRVARTSKAEEKAEMLEELKKLIEEAST